jgi:hypothetical protein
MPNISSSTNCTENNFIVAITPKPVIIIGMRIEKDNNLPFDFNGDEPVDAEYVTEQSMTALWNMVISPMQSQLSEQDITLIGIIGVTLKLVAHKAKCYEDMQQGKGDFSDLSRN